MPPVDEVKRKFDKTFAVEAELNTELKKHTPDKDVYGELICVKCKDAVPCPRARAIFEGLYKCGKYRIEARAKGLVT